MTFSKHVIHDEAKHMGVTMGSDLTAHAALSKISELFLMELMAPDLLLNHLTLDNLITTTKKIGVGGIYFVCIENLVIY